MPVSPIAYAATTFAGLLATTGAALRWLLPHWWKTRAARMAFAALVVANLAGLAVWYAGLATALAWALVPIDAGLALSIVFAGATWQALARLATTATATSTSTPTATPTSTAIAAPRITRRAVLHATTLAMPGAALAGSAAGLVGAQLPQAMPLVPMRFAGLPRALEGIKILHLSDLHLGFSMGLADLRDVLGRARAARPDLVVITGDIADDLSLLGPALRMVAAHGARLGAYAALGNHEYLRGVDEVRRVFDASQVPLLLESGASLDVAGARLFVAGANDPIAMRGNAGAFFARSIDAAFDGAPADAFHLLLCHRPDGFEPAAARGIHLTLSGHTHGAQVGVRNRSAFEPLARHKYLRGPYALAASRLYTSAGFGHWLPFRLNCRAEAPIIVLERA